jgi:hypothetical protein
LITIRSAVKSATRISKMAPLRVPVCVLISNMHCSTGLAAS